MTGGSIAGRFRAHGVFWRQLLSWGVNNIPYFLEPYTTFCWALFFFMLWVPGRRGVVHNLRYVRGIRSPIRNLAGGFRVFWNFAWTVADTVRFREQGTSFDWELEGLEHVEDLARLEGGAIVITAHMGNYDLGAQIFARTTGRKLTMVRIPERDSESERFEATTRQGSRNLGEEIQIRYNTSAEDIALEVLGAIRRGEIVAIQGDRVPIGTASQRISLFGQSACLPTGPFALAMLARVPIYPLFILRTGRRRYRLLALPPMVCERTARDRDRDITRALTEWRDILERVVREYWHQWFNFEPFDSSASAPGHAAPE